MTKPSDRDIDSLLKRARVQPPAASSDVCLDAETIAAWMDGALSNAERAAAERHAADCIWCQAVLTAMARTAPSDAAPVPRWSPWRVARWTVPLSAAAAVVLWFAVDRDVAQRQAAEPFLSAPSQSPTSPSASVPPVVPPPASPPVSGAAVGAAASPAPSDSRRSADAANTTARAERDLRKRERATPPLQDLAARKDVPSQAAPAEKEQRAAAAPPSAAPVPSTEAAPQASPAPPPPPAAATTSLAETVVAPQAAKQTAADAPARGPSQARFRTQVAQRTDRTLWVDVSSPDPLVRWRFSEGIVERSTDGGVTWTREPIESPLPIVAGVAPSSSSCWFVGRGGLVLRFTTARGWQRLIIPNAPDLLAVDAKDADNAAVTFANGRRLTTTDGGVTWR